MTTQVSKESNVLTRFPLIEGKVQKIRSALSFQEAGRRIDGGFLTYAIACQNLMQQSPPLRSVHKELNTALQELSIRVKAAWEKIVPSELQGAIRANDAEKLENIAKVTDLQNGKLSNGELPLHYAIRYGSDRVVRYLLQIAHLETSTKDHHGLTAIDHALLTNNPKMIALVLGASLGTTIPENAPVSKKPTASQMQSLLQAVQVFRFPPVASLHPIHAAAFLGQVNELEALLAKAPISKRKELLEQKDAGRMTAMHYAALGGKQEVVEWLLKRGVQGDQKTVDGMTALHFAALADSGEVIKKLLATGKFNPNETDSKGNTPLHFAMISEKLSAAKALIPRGADLFIQTTPTTPFAIFKAFTKARLSSRDPLKLSGSTIFSLCALTASRMCYLLGYEGGGKVLGSLPIWGMLLKAARSPSLKSKIGSFLGTGEMFAHLSRPDLQYIPTLSSFVYTGSQAKTFLQSIRTAWRSRHFEIYRPFRNALIHGINTVLAGWNTLEPIFVGEREFQREQKEWEKEWRKFEEKFRQGTGSQFERTPPFDEMREKFKKDWLQNNPQFEEADEQERAFLDAWDEFNKDYTIQQEQCQQTCRITQRGVIGADPTRLCRNTDQFNCILRLDPEEYENHASFVRNLGEYRQMALKYAPDKHVTDKGNYAKALGKINAAFKGKAQGLVQCAAIRNAACRTIEQLRAKFG